MIKIIKKTLYSVLIFLILLACLLSFFLTTTPGLYSLIKLSMSYLPGSLKIYQLNGTALKQFSIGEIEYRIHQTTFKIKHLTVNWQLQSLLQNQIIINSLKADSVEVQQDKSMAKLQQINMKGRINKKELTVNSLSFNYERQVISSHLRLELQSDNQLSGTLKLNPETKNSKILTGTLNISGKLTHLQWTGDFYGPASLTVNGSLKELVTLKQTIKWRHIQWQFDPETLINSPEGRVIISGTLPDLAINLTSKINKKNSRLFQKFATERTVQGNDKEHRTRVYTKSHEDSSTVSTKQSSSVVEFPNKSNKNWQIAANIHGTIPWKWYFDINLSQPLDSSSSHEGFYTSLSAQGALTAENQGEMTLTLKPGHYEMPEDALIPSLSFQGGTVKVTLSPKQLVGKGSIAIDENKKLDLVFRLPQFNLSKGLVSSQPISANLSLNINSFEFLQDLSPEISKPKGHLTASLITTGTWGKKIVKSMLNLTQGSVELPTLGLKLKSMQLIAQTMGQHWEAKGTISSENNNITIKGKGPLDASFSGNLSLTGTDFPIMNTKEFQIKISPQVDLNINATGVKISGTILVPFAHIQPQTFANSISLSDDVVFKTNNEAPPTPFNTNIDLRVKMGNEVELTYKGLHATLSGIVNLTQLPQGPVNATGELTVKKGQYKAYGQDLAIEQGQLIFTGGRLDNPGINLRASKKIDTTTATTPGSNQPFDFNNNDLQNANVRGNISVGVEVTGRLTEPKISLFSNPSILSQADILSMLVLGRPASQANKAGGQLLIAAISSMNLGNGTNGTQLLEQLKKTLGVDVNVRTTSNYNLATNQITDSTAVVVGKSFSKKIYISYNVGLSQNDPNVLTLKYLLNKFYSIQISSSTTSSGIDILYTSNKEGARNKSHN